MTLQVPWRTVAEPVGRRLLRQLPAFILKKYYGPQAMEDDIKIRLSYETLKTADLLGELCVPFLEIELEVFNLSPYLDAHVTGVTWGLSARGQDGMEQFASHHDLRGFELLRGRPRPVHVWYWLNKYQAAVVSTYQREQWAMDLFVGLRTESPVGTVVARKVLQISGRDAAH